LVTSQVTVCFKKQWKNFAQKLFGICCFLLVSVVMIKVYFFPVNCIQNHAIYFYLWNSCKLIAITMRPLFSHKFNKSLFNQNSKLTIGEVSFILKQTVVSFNFKGSVYRVWVTKLKRKWSRMLKVSALISILILHSASYFCSVSFIIFLLIWTAHSFSQCWTIYLWINFVCA